MNTPSVEKSRGEKEEERRGPSTGLKDYRPLLVISHPRGEADDDDVTLGCHFSHTSGRSHETASFLWPLTSQNGLNPQRLPQDPDVCALSGP